MTEHAGSAESATVAILIPSWDGYRDVWGAFVHCLFTYWPDCPYDVVLGTNTLEYPDTRVRTICIGADVDYSSNLRAMLHRVDHPWVIVWVDDFLLSVSVDTARTSAVIRLAQQANATSLLLHATNALRRIRRRPAPIAEFPRSNPYRVSLCPALWNRQDLLRLLKDGESAWAFETAGSQRAGAGDYAFYGVTDVGGGPPLAAVNAIVKGRVTPEALDLLQREGLPNPFGARPVLSRGLTWYRRMRPWIPNWLVSARQKWM